MKTKMTVVAIVLLSLLNTINAENDIRWALSNLLEGYTYHDFHDGYAICQDIASKKYGAINTNGEIAIPIVYDHMGDFNGDAVNVKTAEGEGIIDFKNNYLLQPNANYVITPITTEIDNRKQTLQNSFLVTNTSNSTQAIFYKDKFLTDFTPIHSLSYDVQFPFIHVDMGTIVNTETDETVTSVCDMGGYFLTENVNGDITAISSFSGANITPSVIGKDIWREEAKSYTNSLSDGFANDVNNNIDAPGPLDQIICSLSLEGEIWKLSTINGEVKYTLNEADGWICKNPFIQNLLFWFERTIPNTDSTQLKIVYYNGEEILDKTMRGSFRLKFYPTYWRIMGHSMIAYSCPHIFLTEISPEGVEVKTTIECIIRGATLLAKANAAKKKKFASYTFAGGDYMVCGNYLFYPNDGQYIIYDIEKDKTISAQEIVDYSEDLILAKDLSGKYFTIFAENGKVTTLSNFQSVFSFNDDVLIAENKDGKAVIDATGKILFKDGKNLSILTTRCSENAIVALNKETNQVGFMYNPLAKDMLTYGSSNKMEQLYTQGINFYKQKKYNKAKRCFEMLYKHDPKNIDALINYADCFTAQRYYSAAIYHYNKALTIDPSNKVALDHLAIAQDRKERAEYATAITRAICESVYSVLNDVNQNLSSNQSNQSSASTSTISNSKNSTSSNSDRNNSTYWWSLKKSYQNWEDQVRELKIYPEKYAPNVRDSKRQEYQSKMKEIRNKLQQSGYTLNKSELEDWDGR